MAKLLNSDITMNSKEKALIWANIEINGKQVLGVPLDWLLENGQGAQNERLRKLVEFARAKGKTQFDCVLKLNFLDNKEENDDSWLESL